MPTTVFVSTPLPGNVGAASVQFMIVGVVVGCGRLMFKNSVV